MVVSGMAAVAGFVGVGIGVVTGGSGGGVVGGRGTEDGTVAAGCA